jgi:hypothetical protein
VIGGGNNGSLMLTARSIMTNVIAVCVLAQVATAQGVTGSLIGTVKDTQGALIQGARVTVSSPALIGGAATQITNEKGELRFPALPPGTYVLEIAMQGFAPVRDESIAIGAGATIQRTPVLKIAGVAETVAVEAAGPRLDVRNPGVAIRFGAEQLETMPTRRGGVSDVIRAAPGISPTSPTSGTVNSVSAFGSSTNENTFLIDGTDFTSPSNGGARTDPAIDFVQEVHVQSVGASVEYGNGQGAVIDVVTRHGAERAMYAASYHWQPAGLTGRPVQLRIPDTNLESGYERDRYFDLTTSVGGAFVRDRLWFFGGYDMVRDADSQPGTDPLRPRTREVNKMFAKLTWRLAPGWQLEQSYYNEVWVRPEQPTIARPFEVTLRPHGTVPAITFGHLTHTVSANTVWDMRVGRFAFSQHDDPSTGNPAAQSRFDQFTKRFGGGPPQIGNVKAARTTAKATVTHYEPSLVGAAHEFKVGGQLEQGEHTSLRAVPTGVMLVTFDGLPLQSVSSDPSNAGGQVMTAAAFASDAVTLGDRVTVSAGLRFDRSRAISQDLQALDAEGRDTGQRIEGLGALYTWHTVSPRFGMTVKLDADGRTLLRGSYGRYRQIVLTGEVSPLSPGVTPVTTRDFVAKDGDYTRVRSIVDQSNLQLDPGVRPPRTDEYSIEVDREVGHRLAIAVSYVRKDGADFIGWKDVGGQYAQVTATLPDASSLTVFQLAPASPSRLFQLTNPEGYLLSYNGLVMSVEKRRAHGWQASGSYTLSRAKGLLPSSGASAAGEQVSTVGAPPIFFGRDPNDLTNARGRLPNDRPHMGRITGSVDVPHTAWVLAANLQIFSGKPWAATALVPLASPQSSQQRVLIEPRGSRRLSSQTMLDVRVSRTMAVGQGRIDLIVDVLNAFNDTAEEGLVTDDRFSPNFGQPNAFVDPRRVMFGVRLNLGR